MAYSTGEKPGNGTYICKVCGQKVVLDDNTDTLPPCPKCKKTLLHWVPPCTVVFFYH